MANKSYYPIIGIQNGFGSDGEVPERMEIDVWWQSEDQVHVDQVSLFIAALQYFQDMKVEDKLSYFAVAGIHSEPRYPWDEEPSTPGDPKRRRADYCTHNQNLFPTWHRPYVVLYEQRLYEIMTKIIIPRFPRTDQTYLKHAADRWRLPFWDWGAKRSVYTAGPSTLDYDVPQLMRLELVNIRVPTGRKWVRNPLYMFRMPGGVEMSTAGVQAVEPVDAKSIHFEKCIGTSRYPPTNNIDEVIKSTFIEGYQDNDSVKRRLKDTRIGPLPPQKSSDSDQLVPNGGNLSSSLREVVARVLAINDYESFSTKARIPKEKVPAWGSLESLHDNIHGYCGGGYYDEPAYGHMSWVPVAAFDPIFWLHHCNVDRLFATWQILHPKSSNPAYWFSSPQRAQQDLKPFHNNIHGDYWKSDTVYETGTLGYTYSNLPKIKTQRNGAQDIVLNRPLEEINKEINELYGSTRRAEQKSSITGVRQEPVHLKDVFEVSTSSKIQKQIVDTGSSTVPETKDLLEVSDYVANIKYERFALGGLPFTVYIFIGKVPNNNANIGTLEMKNLVDGIFNFVAPAEMDGQDSEGCINCKRQAQEKAESTGSIVLTNALITRAKQHVVHENRKEESNGILGSMKPEDVIPFLKDNLHWRVVGSDGHVVLKEAIPSLKIAVAVGKANHYANPEKLSEYFDYKILYDVTAGRDAGAAPEDHLFPQNDAY